MSRGDCTCGALDCPSCGDEQYPEWICRPCGRRYGRGFPEGHVATFHAGECGICGAEAPVTEPRDFRHLKPNWRDLVAEDKL